MAHQIHPEERRDVVECRSARSPSIGLVKDEGRRHLSDDLGDLGQEVGVDARAAPEHGDLPAGDRCRRSGRRTMSGDAGTGGLHRQLGQQRDAHAGGDHLAQGLEAGGAEAGALLGARRAGTRPAPGRAGSGPPRAAARCRRPAPRCRPARRTSASGWSAGTASTKSSVNSGSPWSWSSCTGRASTPTSSWPSRSRWCTTSVFSSTSSSSRLGKRACSCGTTWGSRYGASVGNSPTRRLPDSGSCGLAGDARGCCRSRASTTRARSTTALADVGQHDLARGCARSARRRARARAS